MLPRLRFVVASLVIAILPMVFLGAGLAPSLPASPAELSRADKPIVLGPAEYSETQYRYDRQTLSYARRATELNKLRELASAPLNAWIAAPAGAEPDNAATTIATVTTDGPAVVTVNSTNPNPDKASEITVSVTVGPSDKRPAEATAQTPRPEADRSAAAAPNADKTVISKPEAATATPAGPLMSDAPHSVVGPMPSGQVFAALGPPKAETSNLPQVHVVMGHPKPRARTVRRVRPAPTSPPVAQRPPPFFELFAWLFNIKPQTVSTQPQPVLAAPRGQPQARYPMIPQVPVRTALQP